MARASHKVGDYRGLQRPTEPERARLELLAEGLDPGTRRTMREIGIGPGWHCLEVGAAEGSMARWMAEQVGPEGRVVAADIDVRFLQDDVPPNMEVRQLDLRSDPLEPGRFDLAYCRTLLMHMPDPGGALASMVSALKPGGVLLAEEPDLCVSALADPDHPQAHFLEDFFRRAWDHLRRTRYMDTRFGRTLAARFQELGLEDVRAEGTVSLVGGGSALVRHLAVSLRDALGPVLVRDGAVSQAELDAVLDCYGDPDFEILNGIQFAVWGRRPAAQA